MWRRGAEGCGGGAVVRVTVPVVTGSFTDA